MCVCMSNTVPQLQFNLLKQMLGWGCTSVKSTCLAVSNAGVQPPAQSKQVKCLKTVLPTEDRD